MAVRLPTMWESGIVIYCCFFCCCLTFMFIVVVYYLHDYLFTVVQKTVRWMNHWYVP